MDIQPTNYMNNTTNRNSQRNLLWLLITIITLPIFLSLAFLFAIYRQIISIVLSLKHGSQFGGLVSVYDAVHAVKDSEKNPVCILFIIQYTRSNSKNFYDIAYHELYRKIFIKSKQNLKASAILRTSLGYPYLLKNFIRSEDCLKKLKTLNCPTEDLEKEDLVKLISELSCEPLPKNGEALWDMSIGTQSVKWIKEVPNGDVVFYPIVLRFHHVLTDGESLVKVILGLFADKNGLQEKLNLTANLKSVPNLPTNFNSKREETKPAISNTLSQVPNQFKYYMKQFYVLCLCPSIMIQQFMRMRDDTNALHGPHIINQRTFAIGVEESPHYVTITKRIKNRIRGCTFLDVLFTAISATIYEYFEKNSVHIPDYVTVGIPESPRTVELLALTPTNNQLSHSCHNQLSYAVHKLRINCGSRNVSLIKRLQLIKEDRSRFRSALELEVGHWLQTVVFGLLPASLNNLIMGSAQVTMIISNMPGPPSISVFGGYPIQDMIPFGAHRERIGVNFVIFTYAGRLQITLGIDKALISEENEVHSILDGVYKYLNMLDSETNKLE